MSDEYGPPTLEDDMWFHEHVRAAEYPKVKRGDKPMEGQRTLIDALEDERRMLDEQRAREDEAQQFRTDRPE